MHERIRIRPKDLLLAVDSLNNMVNRTTTGNLPHPKGNILCGLQYIKGRISTYLNDQPRVIDPIQHHNDLKRH